MSKSWLKSQKMWGILDKDSNELLTIEIIGDSIKVVAYRESMLLFNSKELAEAWLDGNPVPGAPEPLTRHQQVYIYPALEPVEVIFQFEVNRPSW